MTATFGLDFGTTNSVLSINKDGRIIVLDIEKFEKPSKVLRSVIYFDDEKNTFVGQEAITRYFENGACGRFIRSIKSTLPEINFNSTLIGKRNYTLEDLVSIILRRIKIEGEKEIGNNIDSVVLGRPVFFSKIKEEDSIAETRLRIAAQSVGFKNIRFQYEPVAAALSLESSLQENNERIVLVGDFGGGTIDFSIIKFSPKKTPEILALEGLCIGGQNFDSRIMWEKVVKYFGKYAKLKGDREGHWMDMPQWILRNICEDWRSIHLMKERKTRNAIREIKRIVDNVNDIENLENLVDNNHGFSLFQSVEKAKCELSTVAETSIQFKEYALEINESITRGEFEDSISSEIKEISACIDSTLISAGITNRQIDSVCLTGGSSLIPAIGVLFEKKFDSKKIKRADTFTGVAHGLGISADLF